MRRSSKRQIKDIRQGRRQACEAVVRQQYKSIYRFMVYLTGDSARAEDLTQETFACAWASADKFEGRASIETWLHKIAYNKFIDCERKVKRHALMVEKVKEQQRDLPQVPNPLRRVQNNEEASLIYESMHKLQSSEYAAILLHYVQGLSFGEMAKVTEEPVGTIKWRTNKALKKLKAILTGRV